MMLQSITSEENPRLKKAIRLHASRGRKSQGRMLVFGYREIQRAILSGIVPEDLFFCKPAHLSDDTTVFDERTKWLQENVTRFNDAARILPPNLFAKVSYGDLKDAMVMTAARPEITLPNFQPREPRHPLLVVVESIEKPGNLGAVMRSADGAGVDGMLVANPQTDWFHPNAIRASLGTTFSIPAATGSTEAVIEWLKEREFQVLVATLQTEDSIYDCDLKLPTAIVFGNEANGVSEAWRTFKQAGIPMLGLADSLNISAAASVMMYEARRQRGA